MKILIAPDSFKGSLTALEVADNIEKGILRVLPEAKITKLPMADGGEGTVQSLVDATNGEIIKKEVTDPLGNCIDSYFGLLGDGKTAVVEMATASGLPLISSEKANPMHTTTYGTGQLIKAALDKGLEELIVGIGGSATNDGGVGMAQALGVRFLDGDGNSVGFGGKELSKIKTVDMRKLDTRVKDVNIRVACDVNNPLYGPDGAAYVYAPQKGADSEMVKILDNNLRHFASVIKKELGINLQEIQGAGAAGGLGAGLVAFLDAGLEPGIDIILDTSKFDIKVKDVDLVITGEGKIDSQTLEGKTPYGVAKRAKRYKKPVIAVAGMVEEAGLVTEEYIDAVFSISRRPCSLAGAIENTSRWLQSTLEQIIKVYLLSDSPNN